MIALTGLVHANGVGLGVGGSKRFGQRRGAQDGKLT
jgi:hypothetical protein